MIRSAVAGDYACRARQLAEALRQPANNKAPPWGHGRLRRDMKRITLSLGLVAAFVAGSLHQALAAEESWLTDFEKAKTEAATKKLPILADFSGSDWCGWCIKLDKEVFAKAEFLEYAKDNLVLLSLDFPARKPQDAALVKQNKALAAKYGIKGYPTVILLDATGKEIARTGYRAGGPETYIKHLQELLPKPAAPAAPVAL